MSVACQHCGRPFADQNGCFSHIKAKHGKAAAKAFRRERMPEREMSLADELLAAIETMRDGGDPPSHIVAMFPQEFAGSRPFPKRRKVTK
jgi:hypothetical protein